MKQSDFGTISCFGAPSACEASLALTRSVQRWRTKNIRIQSGVASSAVVRDVYWISGSGPGDDTNRRAFQPCFYGRAHSGAECVVHLEMTGAAIRYV